MLGNLSILIAQTNPKLGDIDGNKNIILETIEKNKNCDLLVFSELMLTGYPPEDLVLKSAFQEKFMNAIQEIANYTKSKDCFVLFGSPWIEGDKVFNAAVLIGEGKIITKHFRDTSFASERMTSVLEITI